MDSEEISKQPSSEIPPVPQLSAVPSNSIVPKTSPTAVPTPPPPPVSKNGERDPEADAKYAASLIQMTNMQYEMEQAKKPRKKLISTKKLIYIGLSIVVTIISLIFTPLLLKSKSSPDAQDTTKQLINSSNYVQNLESN
jgi:hypothetical protein